MKKIIVVLFLASLTGCTKDEEFSLTAIDCISETQGTSWLELRIEEMRSSSISQYLYVMQVTFQNEIFFVFSNCCPFCASIPLVYNCNGDLIDDETLYDEILKKEGTLYATGDDFQCNL